MHSSWTANLYDAGPAPCDPGTVHASWPVGTVAWPTVRGATPSGAHHQGSRWSGPRRVIEGTPHLSAYLAEGELIIYQTGTWMVDNIEVGDGTPTVWRLAQVDTIQV